MASAPQIWVWLLSAPITPSILSLVSFDHKYSPFPPPPLCGQSGIYLVHHCLMTKMANLLCGFLHSVLSSGEGKTRRFWTWHVSFLHQKLNLHWNQFPEYFLRFSSLGGFGWEDLDEWKERGNKSSKTRREDNRTTVSKHVCLISEPVSAIGSGASSTGRRRSGNPRWVFKRQCKSSDNEKIT